MQKGIGSSIWLLSVILATACGSSDSNDPTGGAGSAGASSAGSGGMVSAAGGAATGGQHAGSGGTQAAGATTGGGGAAAHAGAGGTSALGGRGGTGGTAGPGGSQTQAGANSGGGPASTAGLPFVGSCVDATHCTDEWDTTFGAETLAQICTAQQGTWSTGHCDPAPWKKKCTQAVFSGVYIQFLPADGICAAGFEETL